MNPIRARRIALFGSLILGVAGCGGSHASPKGDGGASPMVDGGVPTGMDGGVPTELDGGSADALPPVSPQLTLLAGGLGGPGYADATGPDARFDDPTGIVNDGTNLYVADTVNDVIRKIVIATGATTTLAGNAGVEQGDDSTDGTGKTAFFSSPEGLVLVGQTLYVADRGNDKIRAVDIATGNTTTLAGSGGSGFQDSTDSTSRGVEFNQPFGITSDGTYLYVADTYNDVIRKVTLGSGETHLLVGTPGTAGAQDSTDGTGSGVTFSHPWGIATDGTRLYIADHDNNAIRGVTLSSGETGTAPDSIDSPSALLIDGTNAYALSESDSEIYQIDIATGDSTVFAGGALPNGSKDGMGTAASFSGPQGITSLNGLLYVTDSYSDSIRQIEVATKKVTTLAGRFVQRGLVDAAGDQARFKEPQGVVSDGAGHLYITDEANYAVREYDVTSGNVTTLVGGHYGSPPSGSGTTAYLPVPYGITLDGQGNLFLALKNDKTIAKVVIATRTASVLAGQSGVSGSANSTDGTGGTATFSGAYGLVYAGGALYVADSTNGKIRVVDPTTGNTTTMTLSQPLSYPNAIATDGTNLYVTESSGALVKIVIASGEVSSVASGFAQAYGLALDGHGNLYVAEQGGPIVTKVVLASGAKSTVVGVPGRLRVDVGALPGGLSAPTGLAFMKDGRLAILDQNENALLAARF